MKRVFRSFKLGFLLALFLDFLFVLIEKIALFKIFIFLFFILLFYNNNNVVNKLYNVFN
ncbi:hypothetical protein Hanom_Chr14g01311781 [Helianthus anomalus]